MKGTQSNSAQLHPLQPGLNDSAADTRQIQSWARTAGLSFLVVNDLSPQLTGLTP